MSFDEYGHGYGYDDDEPFKQIFRCYPASSLNKPHLENGDKIIMPPFTLQYLAFLNINYPMMFEIRNDAAGRVSHCGVLEFTAEEGMVYMPDWMMEHMLLQEGEMVEIKNVRLPKGTFIKLQPHTKDFLDVSNPKAILETTLRNYSCLTTGDTIMVAYNNKNYYINVVDTKPSNGVCIIETDCEVDFAPPLDYKEPEKPIAAPQKVEEPPVEAEPKFRPFSGAGRRLDGRPVNNEPSQPSSSSSSSSGSKDKRSSVQNENGNGNTHSCAASSSQSNSHAFQGKLVFGSNGNQTAEGKELKQEKSQQKQEPKFQPFSGKKYSLLG